MLHSDQSCPDIPARLDSKTGIDPGKKKKIEKKHQKASLLVGFYFLSTKNEYFVATDKYTTEASVVQQYSLADINTKPVRVTTDEDRYSVNAITLSIECSLVLWKDCISTY